MDSTKTSSFGEVEQQDSDQAEQPDAGLKAGSYQVTTQYAMADRHRHNPQQRQQQHEEHDDQIISCSHSCLPHNMGCHDHSLEVARMRSIYSSRQYPISKISEYNSDLFWMDDSSTMDVLRDSSYYVPTSLTRPAIHFVPDWLEHIILEQEEKEKENMEKHEPRYITTINSVINIVQAIMITPTVLYLPHAMSKSGYATSIPILLLTICGFLFSCDCLLHAWRIEHEQMLKIVEQQQEEQEQAEKEIPWEEAFEVSLVKEDNKMNDLSGEDQPLIISTTATTTKPYNTIHHHHSHKRTFYLSYPELAYRAFHHYASSEETSSMVTTDVGETIQHVVKLCIVLLQSCICLTYCIFICHNLSTIVQHWLGQHDDVTPQWFVLVILVVQIPLSWIVDMRYFSVGNLLASFLILYGLGVCIYLAVQQVFSSHEQHESLSPQNATELQLPTTHLGIAWEKCKNLEAFGDNCFIIIGTSVSQPLFLVMHYS